MKPFEQEAAFNREAEVEAHGKPAGLGLGLTVAGLVAGGFAVYNGVQIDDPDRTATQQVYRIANTAALTVTSAASIAFAAITGMSNNRR